MVIFFFKGRARNGIYFLTLREALPILMESEDFVPGQRNNDPDLDAFRDQMQKNMQTVRVIAIQQSDEIETALSELDDQRSQWKSDMPNLMGNSGKPGRGRGMGRNSEEMRFLLLNPDDKDSFGIF